MLEDILLSRMLERVDEIGDTARLLRRNRSDIHLAHDSDAGLERH